MFRILASLLVPYAAAASCSLPKGKWVKVPDTGAPRATLDAVALWAGSEMVVVTDSQAARYDPCRNSWRTVTRQGMPEIAPRKSRPLVCGAHILFPYRPAKEPGLSYAWYEPEVDRWTSLRTGAPSPRLGAAEACDRDRFALWGGYREDSNGRPAVSLADGGFFDFRSKKWTVLPAEGAPVARTSAEALLLAQRLFLWGGYVHPAFSSSCAIGADCGIAPTGGSFDFRRGKWETLPTSAAPIATFRDTVIADENHQQVLIARKHGRPMIFALDLPAKTWTSIPVPEAVLPDRFAAVVRDGALVLVSDTSVAYVYDARHAQWHEIAGASIRGNGYSLPSHAADVWIRLGRQQALGGPQNPDFNRGGEITRLDVERRRWEVGMIARDGSPRSILSSAAVWTGDCLVFWGGSEWVHDPTGSNGCPPRSEGPVCDPSEPLKQVVHQEGGLFCPRFHPVVKGAKRRPG